MKKIAKLSLVAAVAVAGLSTANAKPLEEAIKNVDVSGTVVYRYNDKGYDDYKGSKGYSTTDNNYKIGLSLKAKVAQDVTLNTRFLVANDKGSFAGLDAQSGADGNVNTTLSHVNFAYTGIKNTTVMVGKQGLATPWTRAIDADGSEQTGTGVLALSTFGMVTAGAGYFNQTNITAASADGVTYSAGKDLMVAALMANMGMVKAEAWYLDIDEAASQYFVKAATKVGPIKAYAQYSSLDADTETDSNNDVSLLKVGAKAKFGMINAAATYAKGGKDGTGILNGVAPGVSAIGYTVNAAGKADAKAYFLDLGAQVLPKLHVGLNYDMVEAMDGGKEKEHSEAFVQVTYKHAKNLSAYVRLASGDDEFASDKGDYSRGRLQVQYSF